MGYTFGIVTSGTMEDVERSVTAALGEEGFGVLTRIDVKATFKEKLDVDRDPYVILGACNPILARSAIDAEPDIGALLPCNVVLRQDGETVVIRFMDPHAVLGIVGHPAVDELGAEVRAKLERVAAAIMT